MHNISILYANMKLYTSRHLTYKEFSIINIKNYQVCTLVIVDIEYKSLTIFVCKFMIFF